MHITEKTRGRAKGLPRAGAGRSPSLAPRSRIAAAAIVALALALAAPGPAMAQEAPLVLTWAQLVPPAPPGQQKGLKSFLGNRPPPGASAEHNPQVAEGRWLSPGAGPQQSQGPVPVVDALDGRRVRIGGYVVPLDFDATRVKEFLLVPFVGACIHVPPPPANQLVYVKSDTGFDVKGSFDPVWVTGKLATRVAFTGLAEAGYSLEAEKVEARPE